MVKSYHKFILAGIIVLALILRLYRLAQVPIGLHGDEVGVGYNAYSLLKTGRDEYGVLWPITLRADIPPLNFYLTAVSLMAVGKTDVGVRLPAVIYGVLTVWLTYILAKKLFSVEVGLLASLFLAISPWHVQASRIAHEANLGLLLQIAGTILFIKSLTKPWLMLGATTILALSLYAYHGPRLTTPLLIMALIIIFRHKLRQISTRWLVISGLGWLILVLPVIRLAISQPISQNRLAGISIFIREVTLKPAREESRMDAWLPAVVFHNPVWVYGLAIARQYWKYLNGDYLFFDSSSVRYFNVKDVGLMYVWDLPFLIAGLYQLWQWRRKPASQLALAWLVMAPIPGALTLGPPNAGRSFMMLPIIQLITAIGFIDIWNKKWLGKWAKGIVGGGLVYNVLVFGHQYFVHSRHEFAIQWGYGLKEAAQIAVGWENSVERIIFTDTYKEPYVYVLFYGNKSPEWFNRLADKQRHGFIGYSGFDKYEFRAINWQVDGKLTNSLIVGGGEEIPEDAEGIVSEIRLPDDSTALRIVKT